MNSQLAVNFHLWEPCNYSCKFCFAKFQDVKSTILPKGHLTKHESVELVKLLGEYGFGKITFAGGEPTLCPWLYELVCTARDFGMTAGIISNGTIINDQWLTRYSEVLNWIGISIDSLDAATNQLSGRFGRHSMPEEKYYYNLCIKIKEFGYKLKINTVVHRLNMSEVMLDFIESVGPERWKILQVLEVDGQNNQGYLDMSISKHQFDRFLQNNFVSTMGIKVAIEKNDLMRGSYLMVDPAGRFFDNVSGGHVYSETILDVGIGNALKQVKFYKKKFIERGGNYDW